MHVRQATLDDTQAISALFQKRIPKWQRVNPQGQVEDLPYGDLNIYERWLHGGAWMSIETAAIWLSHLLSGAGFAYVVVDDRNKIIAYAEVYEGDEPAPYGKHLYVAHHITVPDAPVQAADALMQFLIAQAEPRGRIMTSCSAYDEESANLYRRYGMAIVDKIQQINLPAQSGQGFYKVTAHATANPGQIASWSMSVGRLTSSRHQWETVWPNLWQAVPEIVKRRTFRQRFVASGQEAFVCYQQQLYAPRSADLYVWTPKSLSPQLLIALRDWGYQQGFRTLVMAVTEKIATVLGTDGEKTPYQQHIYARNV